MDTKVDIMHSMKLQGYAIFDVTKPRYSMFNVHFPRYKLGRHDKLIWFLFRDGVHHQDP